MIVLLLIVLVLLGAHAASCAHVALRVRADSRRVPPDDVPPAALLRPACGQDHAQLRTLSSGLPLGGEHRAFICVENYDDPCIENARRAVASSAGTATLMVGRGSLGQNPKMNNLQKGWESTTSPIVVMTDSNVEIPRDYLQRMYAPMRGRPEVGCVSAPPVASEPDGAWATLECAFINTYEARWHLFADWLGLGFAHGKNMLVRRELVEAAGGIRVMCEVASEDAALTNALARAGRRVVLTSPFPQPLGRRTLSDVLGRQLRWARLRRRIYPHYFLLELASTGALPLLLSVAALLLGAPWWTPAATALAYYGMEASCAISAGWYISPTYVAMMPLRDVLLQGLHLIAWHGSTITWRGKTTSLDRG